MYIWVPSIFILYYYILIFNLLKQCRWSPVTITNKTAPANATTGPHIYLVICLFSLFKFIRNPSLKKTTVASPTAVLFDAVITHATVSSRTITYVLVHQTRQREKQTWSVAKKDHTNPNPRKMGGEGKSVKCSTVEPEQRIIKFPLRSLNYSHRRPFDGASCSLKQWPQRDIKGSRGRYRRQMGQEDGLRVGIVLSSSVVSCQSVKQLAKHNCN
jgi:hypothetical protein